MGIQHRRSARHDRRRENRGSKAASFAGNGDAPVVIHNLKYWGTPRNDGFVMMPNDVEAHKTGAEAFEHRGTDGFMIMFDMASTHVKQ